MNKAVRVILVVYLLGVALLCTYVPLRMACEGAAIGMRWDWIWRLRIGRDETPTLDVYRVAVELLALSALAERCLRASGADVLPYDRDRSGEGRITV